MKKAICIFLSFFYFLSCQATEPLNQCIVLLVRGQSAYLVLSRDMVDYAIGTTTASQLSGTGDFEWCIGNLGLSTFNNLDEGTYEITLSSNVYTGAGNPYRLVNGTSTCNIGLYVNFDVNGNTTPFNRIVPDSNPYILRESSCDIAENHAIWFYLIQDPANVFTTGVYGGIFTISFVYI